MPTSLHPVHLGSIWSSSPQHFWHQDGFHRRWFFHRDGEAVWGLFKHITFTVHFDHNVIIWLNNYTTHYISESGSPELIFLQLNGLIQAWWERVTPEVCSYVQSTLWFCFDCCHCRKPCFTKIACSKWKQAFQCFVAISATENILWQDILPGL